VSVHLAGLEAVCGCIDVDCAVEGGLDEVGNVVLGADGERVRSEASPKEARDEKFWDNRSSIHTRPTQTLLSHLLAVRFSKSALALSVEVAMVKVEVSLLFGGFSWLES